MRNKRLIWLFDVVMLLAVCGLEAKMLTGVLIHEWMGVVLALAIIGHLLLQWPWVESHARRVFSPRTWRQRVNFALNTLFFLAMAATTVSGIMISEHVLVRSGQRLEDSITWHSIHGFAGHAIMFIAGLHLALNWDWIVAIVRGRFRPRPAEDASPPSRTHVPSLRTANFVRGLATVLLACGLAGAGTYGIEKSMAAGGFEGEDAYAFAKRGNGSDGMVLRVPAGQERERHDGPAAPDTIRMNGYIFVAGQPSMKFGFPTLVITVVVVGLSAFVGRKILRLHL